MNERFADDGEPRGAAPAANPLEALRAWAGAAAPAVDLLAIVDPTTLSPAPALRRQGGEWLPVALPPVRISRIPPRPVVLSLDAARREAFEDLLFSLGLNQVLVAPFTPRTAGALVLARSGAPFNTEEAQGFAAQSAGLARALAQAARRRGREGVRRDASREVAVLFDLARDLAQADGPSFAAQAAAHALQELLGPVVGAVLVRPAADEDPAVVSWPEGGDAGALRRAAASMGAQPAAAVADDGDAGPQSAQNWLVSPSPSPLVGVALGWSSPALEAAERIVGAVQASLALAADRLAAQRRGEEDRLRAVVEGLPQGVALLASDGRLRLINRAGRRLLEQFGDWPGPGERLERIGAVELAPLVHRAQAGRPAEAEVFSSALSRTLEIALAPAPQGATGADSAGETLLILEDVTDERRRGAQLARAERLSALGVLISGIVHEINNPLTTIIGYAEMLSGAPDGATRERWLTTLADEARRCQRIVGDLLTFARPQTPGRRTVALGAIAEKALALVAHARRRANIEAVLENSPDTPAVEADPDAMLQLLINLLTNAIHALEGCEGRRQIRVSVAPEGAGRVILTVSDTGPGIAPEHQDRVFDPFFTTKPEGKGTGLGLSLVAASVRDHGGEIELQSAPGAGATFRIALPVKAPTAARGSEPAGVGAVELSGARVLVVDDEGPAAGALADMLEAAGARADVLRDGPSALHALLDNPPDVVIWDLSMTGVSGRALLDELERRAPELLDRLIFASGEAAQAESLAALRDAARPVLGKPFDRPLVLRTVGEVARHGRPGKARGRRADA